MSAAGPRRTRVVAVWIVLAVLAGAVVYTEFPAWFGRGGEEEADEDAARMWMPVAPDDLAAVEVLNGGSLHRFERDPQGIWFYHGIHASNATTHEHTVDQAASERISKALSGTARAKLEREVPLEGGRGEQYGVATPRTIVLFYRKEQSQPVAQYAVGDLAPDGSSRYVLMVGAKSAFTLPEYQVTNLLYLVDSFANPAAATAKPSGNPPPIQ